MKINTDNTTNAAIAVMAAIELGEKLTGHPLPVETKATLLEIFLGIGLWFTGKPSPTTNRILNHLGIANDLAVTDTRAATARTDLGTPLTGDRVGEFGTRSRSGDAPLDAATLERLANDSDYGRGGDRRGSSAWVSAPETIEPNSDRAKSAAWYAADVARGHAVSPADMARVAQSGDDGDNGPRSEAW